MWIRSVKLVGLLTAFICVCMTFVFCACSRCDDEGRGDDNQSQSKALERVLYVQQLYNMHPDDEDITDIIGLTVDSMRRDGRNPYYYAAVNVLIDRLFSVSRFAEADSLAVRMAEEAAQDGDSLSMAMARRVRAQMFYKLSQPERALNELIPAAEYVGEPYCSRSCFGTATSIQEWLWIISRDLGDSVMMNNAGIRFSRLAREYSEFNGWKDESGHYPVSAFAFRAENAFTHGDISAARLFLDSAESCIVKGIPSRAYEHLYSVRCRIRAADGDWEGAIKDVDTLLYAHKDFPWFYLKGLKLKAEILNMAGRHKQSASAYSRYISFHDSLSNMLTDKRLNDLTLLYRSEIDHEQHKTNTFRIFAFISVIIILLILLIFAIILALREKQRIRFLVERLKDYDRMTETVGHTEPAQEGKDISMLDRLDSYMASERPFMNPALGRRELAEYLCIGQDALGQLIKSGKGMSVRSYINSCRLEEARKVLGSESNEGIAEMAVRLGFGTARTLQRAFKEKYDMSPTQYREASRAIGNS